MNSIWFLGDVHAEFEHIYRAIEAAAVRPVAVVFLGDIESPMPFDAVIGRIESYGVRAYWIIGNHDTDSESNYRHLQSPLVQARCIDGRVVEIAGQRIGGLGGIFRGEIWRPIESSNGRVAPPNYDSYSDYATALRQKQGIQRRLSKLDVVRAQATPRHIRNLVDETKNGKLRKHQSSIFPDTVAQLATLKADVLVSHEAPGCHPHGFAEIDVLARTMGVKTAIHGHHHDHLDYSMFEAAMGFRTYGVGLCGITDQSGKVIVPGALDHHRGYRELRFEQ
ncbi:MAG: metallophosphoesterase [Rhodocyclaceae bacterium]|nr:metallophosphoesterase [Rhodocyclaceae bacterium]